MPDSVCVMCVEDVSIIRQFTCKALVEDWHWLGIEHFILLEAWMSLIKTWIKEILPKVSEFASILLNSIKTVWALEVWNIFLLHWKLV